MIRTHECTLVSYAWYDHTFHEVMMIVLPESARRGFGTSPAPFALALAHCNPKLWGRGGTTTLVLGCAMAPAEWPGLHTLSLVQGQAVVGHNPGVGHTKSASIMGLL